MKIEELQIGNWVYIWNYSDITSIDLYPVKILSIIQGFPHEDMNIIEGIIPQENGYGVFSRPANDWKPIPITAEIFEKNGIKKVDYDYLKPNVLFESEDKRIQVTDVTNNGEGYWNVHIDNEDYETIGSCDVKYVHQFQQLLRLCGYEMDFVL